MAMALSLDMALEWAQFTFVIQNLLVDRSPDYQDLAHATGGGRVGWAFRGWREGGSHGITTCVCG